MSQNDDVSPRGAIEEELIKLRSKLTDFTNNEPFMEWYLSRTRHGVRESWREYIERIGGDSRDPYSDTGGWSEYRRMVNYMEWVIINHRGGVQLPYFRCSAMMLDVATLVALRAHDIRGVGINGPRLTHNRTLQSMVRITSGLETTESLRL